jgi:hypothetical protein
MVQVSINGQQVSMELDTGSPVTILSEKTWRHQLGKPRLDDSTSHLISYTGHQLKILGELRADVEVDGRVEALNATVVKTDRRNLLGRDWLRVLKLNWHEIFTVKPTAKHGNADCLSRLPMGPDPIFEREQTYHSIVCQLQSNQPEHLPVSTRTISEATRKDPVMCRVFNMILSGSSGA